MEPLNEEDLQWLTIVENRLMRFRRRETANKNTLTNDFTEIIEALHRARQMLQGRFGVPTDRDLD